MGINNVGGIVDDISYECEVSISAGIKEAAPSDDKGLEHYNRNHNVKKTVQQYQEWYSNKVNRYNEAIRIAKQERKAQLEAIIDDYDGVVLDEANFDDSIVLKIQVTGLGLKDLLQNHPYIFDMSISIEFEASDNNAIGEELSQTIPTILAPDADAPIITLIDSGVQENHHYLENVIRTALSKCYIPSKQEDDTGDYVSPSGHGTKVAGGIIYGNSIPKTGSYKPICYIRNIRILDENNCLTGIKDLRKLYKTIIIDGLANPDDNLKIYNNSINNKKLSKSIYMSPLSTQLDDLSYENDILFIQSAGNILEGTIRGYLNNGYSYPQYMYEEDCKITPPGDSLHSLTVGSIGHSDYTDTFRSVLGGNNKPSSFSRIGPGRWDSIKPDLVEYGGEWLKNNGDTYLTINDDAGIEAIGLTPPLITHNNIGTSFSTPKVTHIAANLQAKFPNYSSLLFKTLIISSAQRPEGNGGIQDVNKVIKHYGYGIPNLERALYSDDHRVVLVTPKDFSITSGEAHIFQVGIPNELINDFYDVLVSITLSYKAKPRRTRRTFKGYLSHKVSWTTSRKGETIESFRSRTLHGDEINRDERPNIDWQIGPNFSNRISFSRNSNTVQKDRGVIQSDMLTEKFCIGVIGSKGRDETSRYPAKYSLAVSFELVNKEIPIHSLIENLINIQIQNEAQTEIQDIADEHQGDE